MVIADEFADYNDFAAAVERFSFAERLNYLKRTRISRFRYKFYSVEDSTRVDYVRDVVVRSRLWLSSPDDFNDPFDMRAKIRFDGTIQEKRERIRKNLKEHGFSYSEREKLIPEILRKPAEEQDQILERGHSATISSTGVCCFGGDPLNILMWSHYANKHAGFCFQFDIAEDPRTFLRFVAIDYNDDFPLINWTTKFAEGLEILLKRKHPGWRYEKETRIVIPERSHQYLSFRSEALAAVVIGCRAREKENQTVQDLLGERLKRGYPPPKLYRALRHPTKYKLMLKKEP